MHGCTKHTAGVAGTKQHPLDTISICHWGTKRRRRRRRRRRRSRAGRRCAIAVHRERGRIRQKQARVRHTGQVVVDPLVRPHERANPGVVRRDQLQRLAAGHLTGRKANRRKRIFSAPNIHELLRIKARDCFCGFFSHNTRKNWCFIKTVDLVESGPEQSQKDESWKSRVYPVLHRFDAGDQAPVADPRVGEQREFLERRVRAECVQEHLSNGIGHGTGDGWATGKSHGGLRVMWWWCVGGGGGGGGTHMVRRGSRVSQRGSCGRVTGELWTRQARHGCDWGELLKKAWGYRTLAPVSPIVVSENRKRTKVVLVRTASATRYAAASPTNSPATTSSVTSRSLLAIWWIERPPWAQARAQHSHSTATAQSQHRRRTERQCHSQHRDKNRNRTGIETKTGTKTDTRTRTEQGHSTITAWPPTCLSSVLCCSHHRRSDRARTSRASIGAQPSS